MIAAIEQLHAREVRRAPICIGVHGLFAGDAHAELAAAGVARIVTCNTIRHATNAIDVLPDIASAARDLLAVG
jgi:ribose-phosphate pyrophosphokinase